MIAIIKHISNEGPGILEEHFKEAGYTVQNYNLYSGDVLPEKVSSFQAVVVLGGPMNVYQNDKYPFLEEENIFIDKILKHDIPFLGICLGAQLLAKACKAQVTRAPVKEIGWKHVFLTREGFSSPLFYGLSKKIPVFQWHGDTFDLPENATLLATAPLCPHQAFRIGNYAYGIQFHFEMSSKMIFTWFEEGLNHEISKKELENIKSITYKLLSNYKKNFDRICLNFIQIIAQRWKHKFAGE